MIPCHLTHPGELQPWAEPPDGTIKIIHPINPLEKKPYGTFHAQTDAGEQPAASESGDQPDTPPETDTNPFSEPPDQNPFSDPEPDQPEYNPFTEETTDSDQAPLAKNS